MDNNNKEKFHENYIEGRNAVLEAFRSGKTIDKLFVLDGCQDGPIKSITREARKHDAIINYVAKQRHGSGTANENSSLALAFRLGKRR